MASKIDLTLAVNYIPACSCVIRLLLYLLFLSIFQTYEDNRTYVLLGAFLYIDRKAQGDSVFLDGSSIILTVFFSNVYQHIRQTSNSLHFQVLLVSFLWSVLSGILIIDKGFLAKTLGIPHTTIRSLEIYPTFLTLCYLLYNTAQEEPYGCVLVKALAFGLLVIIWTYIMGWQDSLPRSSSAAFVVRFMPILVLPIWMAVVFSVICMGLLAWLFKQNWDSHERDSLHQSLEEGGQDSSSSNKPHPPQPPPQPIEIDTELEAMFRQAKALREQ